MEVSLIHPLESASPTGMGVAADGLTELLVPDQAAEAGRLNRRFRWINDRMIGGPLRLVARMGLAQMAPSLMGKGPWMVFSSHHAPLWSTGRHVVIVYDLIALRHGRQAPMQYAFYRRLLPRVLKSATRIVTISGAVRDELKATFAFLADREIDVIPAWSKAMDTQGTVAQRELSADRHVLVVGARYPHKNLGLVLDAMAKIADEGMGKRLVVAGVRADLWSHRASWRRLEEAGLLMALDFPTDQEISDLYDQASCLVYPSLMEGQGLPPLEAMKRGCPVICSDIPVLRETCGRASYYVEPQDSSGLAALLVDLVRGERVSELEEMQKAVPEVLARFSAPVIQSKWRTLLGTLQ